MTTTHSLENVSGTAFWIAYSRALESKRPDPLFRDPWAAELAGSRGKRVMRELEIKESHAWLMAVRTAILDRLILDGIAQQGFDTVINLGAGLDTRAFRLPLPEGLNWLEVDCAEIVEYKRGVLGDATPRCNWTPIVADLSVSELRRDLLQQLTAAGGKILVVTEGLLEYLPEHAVRTLASELHALPGVHTWLLNLYANIIYRRTKRQREILAKHNAAFLFAPRAGSAFFDSCGWRETDWSSFVTQGVELDRMPLGYRLALALCMRLGTPKFREQVRRLAGVARLQRRELAWSTTQPTDDRHGEH